MQDVSERKDAEAVVVVGGGGHACCVVDFLRDDPKIRFAGYVALAEGPLGRLGLAYLGTDEALRSWEPSRVRLLLGVGGVESNASRRQIYARLSKEGYRWLSVRHPAAVVAASATLGEGVQCLPGSVVNAFSRVGKNAIVNTNATVEHDCVVGDHAHVAPAATLCGGVTVGAGTLIGAGAVVIPGVSIGPDALVAAGSVVVSDVEGGARVASVPARPQARDAG